MAQLGTKGLSDNESIHILESLSMITCFHSSLEARMTAHWIALASAWMGAAMVRFSPNFDHLAEGVPCYYC